MISLKSLAVTSSISAAIGFALLYGGLHISVPMRLAVDGGDLCWAICLGIAAYGIWAHKRRGAWLLLPIVPASVGPLLYAAIFIACYFYNDCL